MLFANCKEFGGNFHQEVRASLDRAVQADIATGYVSEDVLKEFQQPLANICHRRGVVRLLVGMAFYEGIQARPLQQLHRIHDTIGSVGNGSGVYVATERKFHGKIYQLTDAKKESRTYVGSSNFSRSGLSGNLECTVRLQEAGYQKQIQNYLNYLLRPENAVVITKAEIIARGTEEYKKRITIESLNDLRRCDPQKIKINPDHGFKYSLRRVSSSEKSGLNAYFGKGRLSRRTGFIKARPWYEVELIAPSTVNHDVYYPKGEFVAYTDDGYVIPMQTSGSNFKNIRSKHKLEILGEWIKGKLQSYGALEPLEPVTGETLDKFGSDTIEFYKLKDKEYFMRFLPNTSESEKKGAGFASL
jgi:hypothetical protein